VDSPFLFGPESYGCWLGLSVSRFSACAALSKRLSAKPMTEILALLQNIAPLLEPTTFRQVSQVVFGMLVISGRITMLGLSRWTEKGGSYRTLQRLYHRVLPWKAIQWLFFRKRFLKPEDEYIVADDEVVVSKAGKKTHGLDRFSRAFSNRSFRVSRFSLFPW
jgi:hypothetical protein